MKIFLFAASFRRLSFNKKLINLTDSVLRQQGHINYVADFAAFNIPLYNEDLDVEEIFPQDVLAFGQRMNESDAVIISSPEYNYSIPGTLKNLIDWLSRVKPCPLRRKNILLLSASPTRVGGNRGLWATRVPLEACGAYVFPDMFSLALADSAFDENGNLKDPSVYKLFVDKLQSFTDFVNCQQSFTSSTS